MVVRSDAKPVKQESRKMHRSVELFRLKKAGIRSSYKRYPVPPGMCSPRRPFFKYHGPGPDHRSPGAMEICYMVVAEKDEGENKRGSDPSSSQK